MNKVFHSYAATNRRAQEDPTWWTRVGKPALLAEDPNFGEGGGYWFDADHPAWKAGLAARHPERAAAEAAAGGGCSDCGGKINAAQIKASPAAMEEFLSGE